jgi:crooked neck
MSFAQFELLSAGEEGNIERARSVYDKANNTLRLAMEKEERVLLLEAWKEFEAEHGDDESIEKLKTKLPKRIKRRQRVQADDGVSCIWILRKASCLLLIINNDIFALPA